MKLCQPRIGDRAGRRWLALGFEDGRNLNWGPRLFKLCDTVTQGASAWRLCSSSLPPLRNACRSLFYQRPIEGHVGLREGIHGVRLAESSSWRWKGVRPKFWPNGVGRRGLAWGFFGIGLFVDVGSEPGKSRFFQQVVGLLVAPGVLSKMFEGCP